jgi:hypothetical protein
MVSDAAVKTYRYLRISMIGVVGLLAVSVVVERSDVDCWQNSISAYYYTPVRAILVGGLMAVGLCLIVIKGGTAWEDATLNFAGMLAPVVAVVPTTDVGVCWSVEPRPRPIEPDGSLAGWVVANIDNNITALLVTGIAGLLVALVIAMIATGDALAVVRVGDLGTRLGLLGAMLLLLFGAAAFAWWDNFDTQAHGIAAVAMFAFLAAGVAGGAWQLRHSQTDRVYFWIYAAIAVLMVATAVVLLTVGSGWQHMVLILETIEIALFAAFWLAQTAQHWNETA